MSGKYMDKALVAVLLSAFATSANAMVAEVPETSSLALIALGVVGLLITRRRSKQ